MAATINDRDLIVEIEQFIGAIVKVEYDKTSFEFKHPLDEDILKSLTKIKPSSEEEELSYKAVPELNIIWQTLLDKSIKCLRFFDKREPFQKNPKKDPVSYGLEKVVKYYKEYSEFEGILYGNSSNYRDHILHSIRTWLLGIFCLLKEDLQEKKTSALIHEMIIEGENGHFSKQINFFEKISMWTIMALCHDLGYPLEKSQEIFNKTREMLGTFVANPRIWTDVSFSGIQDDINKFIVNFMSSKMKEKVRAEKEAKDEKEEKNKYYGRIQPKYYLKFTKSLENYKHGIISAIIIYKMLVYFIEADFNLNEDYIFSEEDAKQFYIRRDILRAISAHTCTDIYHVRVTTFPSLLMICDELQEWGRKSWKDLYYGTPPDSKVLNIEEFNENNISVFEKVKLSHIEITDIKSVVEYLSRIYTKQYDLYRTIFRDGQETCQRTFGFAKRLEIELKRNGTNERKIIVKYNLDSADAKFNVGLSQYTNTNKDREGLIDMIDKVLKEALPKHLSYNVTITTDSESDK